MKAVQEFSEDLPPSVVDRREKHQKVAIESGQFLRRLELLQ